MAFGATLAAIVLFAASIRTLTPTVWPAFIATAFIGPGTRAAMFTFKASAFKPLSTRAVHSGSASSFRAAHSRSHFAHSRSATEAGTHFRAAHAGMLRAITIRPFHAAHAASFGTIHSGATHVGSTRAPLTAERRTHSWATHVLRTMATMAAFAATFLLVFAAVLAAFATSVVFAALIHAATFKATSATVRAEVVFDHAMDSFNQLRRELILHLAGVSFEGQPMGRHLALATFGSFSVGPIAAGAVAFGVMALLAHLGPLVLGLFVVIVDHFNTDGAITITCFLQGRHALHAEQAGLADRA